MKTKPCIFVFFLCELILISVVAIKSSIDEKQSSAAKDYKTKIEVDMDECWRGSGEGGYWGREHGDVDMGGWLGRGTPRRRGMGGSGGENKGASGEEVNESPGGEGGGEHKGGSGGSEKEGPVGEGGGGNEGPRGKGRGETKGPGGGGGGGNEGPGGKGGGETKGPGGEGGGGNEGPGGKGRGETKGPGGEGGGIENGDHVEHP